MILAFEDVNSKLVEVVANVDDEDRVGNSLLHTLELRLGNFCSNFEHKVSSGF